MRRPAPLWFVRGLIRIFPPAFRSRQAAPMEEAFVDQWQEVRSTSGWPGLVALGLTTVLGALATALRLWSEGAWSTLAEVLDPRQSRAAVRLWRRAPGFSILIVVTLALAMGTATMVASTIEAVWLRGLPFPHAERLVVVTSSLGGRPVPMVSSADFHYLHEHLASIEELSGMVGGAANVRLGDTAHRADLQWVTPEMFRMLGVKPIHGRGFRFEDGVSDQRVMLITHAYWRRHFGGDPEVVGTVVQVDGRPRRILGVLPPGFRFELPAEIAASVADADLWLAQAWRVRSPPTPNDPFLTVVGRLRPEVTLTQAQEELDQRVRELRRRYPEYAVANLGLRIQRMEEAIVREVRPLLVVLACAVALLLLIALANSATLVLLRARRRQRELAIRISLGASAPRLVGAGLWESCLLVLVGTVAGLGLARLGIALLVRFGPPDVDRWQAIVLTPRAATYAFVVAAVLGLLLGLLATRLGGPRDLGRALAAGRRVVAGPRSDRLRPALVVVQISLSVVLMIGSVLLLRSFLALTRVDLGFHQRDDVVTLRLFLPYWQYPTEERAAMFRQVEERIAELPGVDAVGSVSRGPLQGNPFTTSFRVDGQVPEAWDRQLADRLFATPRYFETLGIPLLAGRSFSPADRYGGARVAIVSTSLARAGWPDLASPAELLGRKIRLFVPTWTDEESDDWFEVVGVVGHVRTHDLIGPEDPQVYLPHHQFAWPMMTLHLRSELPLAALLNETRQAVRQVVTDAPVYDIRPLSDYVAGARAETDSMLVLMMLFAGVGLVLTAVGLYAVMAVFVRQRRSEIGVRTALGATGREIVLLVLRRGALLTCAGVGAGVLVAPAATRVLASRLFGVASLDPSAFAAGVLAMAAIAGAACLGPTWQAIKVDPIRVLREE